MALNSGHAEAVAEARLKRIALIAHSELRFFLVDLSRALKDTFGSEVNLYCGNKEEVSFYKKIDREGLFASIQVMPNPLHIALDDSQIEPRATVKKARQYESIIGCTYNTLAHANRHLGRGYVLGGPGHPRSRYSENTSYVQMLNAFNRTFDYWGDEVRDKGITLFLSGDKTVARAAVANDVPFRRLAGARYKNFYYWTPNEFFESDEIFSRFADIRDDNAVELMDAYHSHNVMSRHIIKQDTLPGFMRRLLVHCLRRIYWRIRRYEVARGYFAIDELRYMCRQRRDNRRMTGKFTRHLNELPSDQPFLFFPLHTEPEASVNQLSPEYFYQHAAIAALSRDLPAGILLAVKETVYGTGRRPRDFYRQIAELKNVVWLHMHEPGNEVVRRAAAVATITGTAGFEAAVWGKPVISFGQHNLYNFLPHVFPYRDETTLGKQVAALFDGSVDKKQARADGNRFLKAVIESSFSMGRHSALDLDAYDAESVSDAVDKLFDSLKPGLIEVPSDTAVVEGIAR